MFINTMNANDIQMLLSFLSTFAIPDLIMSGQVDLKKILPADVLPANLAARGSPNLPQHTPPTGKRSNPSGDTHQQRGPISLSTMTYNWRAEGRSLIAAFYGCGQQLVPDRVMRIENTRIKTFSNTSACELITDIIMDVTHIFDLPNEEMLEQRIDLLYDSDQVSHVEVNPYVKALDADKYESRFRNADKDSPSEWVQTSVKKRMKQELQTLHNQQHTSLLETYKDDPFEVFYRRYILQGQSIKCNENPLSLKLKLTYTFKIDEQHRLQEISFQN
jgi:hypothetical protein